jgi:hypothetical protein
MISYPGVRCKASIKINEKALSCEGFPGFGQTLRPRSRFPETRSYTLRFAYNHQVTDQALRDHVVNLLRGGSAHLDFDAAIKNFPVALRGKRPPRSPHSAWELLEHLRIAQRDILEFSRDANHQSPEWPEGYWPKTPAPPGNAAWSKSVRAFREDLEAMCALVADPSTDLFARIPHGDGQTVLREAFLLADHNSYHLGQLVLVRKLVGG